MADRSAQPQGSERGAEGTRNVPVFVPAADIYETKDALVLSLELPGVAPDAVNITVEKRALTITGRSRSDPPEGPSLTHHQSRDRDYARAFTVSEAFDGDNLQAELRDG